MKKRKNRKKEQPAEMITVCLYGIFNSRTKKLVKISLDQLEVDMEFALCSDPDLKQCECPVTLIF